MVEVYGTQALLENARQSLIEARVSLVKLLRECPEDIKPRVRKIHEVLGIDLDELQRLKKIAK